MPEKPSLHEDYDRQEPIKSGSDKSFGVVFAVVFTVIGLWPLKNAAEVHIWALVVAAIFLVLALLAPGTLKPLNRVWFRFGLLLHKVVNPLVMGLIFYTTITPMALVMRALGKDPLNRRFDAKAKTYWIERQPPGPEPETMKNQF